MKIYVHVTILPTRTCGESEEVTDYMIYFRLCCTRRFHRCFLWFLLLRGSLDTPVVEKPLRGGGDGDKVTIRYQKSYMGMRVGYNTMQLFTGFKRSVYCI